MWNVCSDDPFFEFPKLYLDLKNSNTNTFRCWHVVFINMLANRCIMSVIASFWTNSIVVRLSWSIVLDWRDRRVVRLKVKMQFAQSCMEAFIYSTLQASLRVFLRMNRIWLDHCVLIVQIAPGYLILTRKRTLNKQASSKPKFDVLVEQRSAIFVSNRNPKCQKSIAHDID